MKATVVEKNGLDHVLTRMSQRMGLANYTENTIVSYCRSVRALGIKIGKSLVNVEQDELHDYLLLLKDRMSQSSWHTILYGIKYCYVEVLEMPDLVNSLPKSQREKLLFGCHRFILNLPFLFNTFLGYGNLSPHCLA